jgi:hypothetical protein
MEIEIVNADEILAKLFGKPKELDADGLPFLTEGCECLGCKVLKLAKDGKIGVEEMERHNSNLTMLADLVNALANIPQDRCQEIIQLAQELNQPVLSKVTAFTMALRDKYREYGTELQAEGGSKPEKHPKED